MNNNQNIPQISEQDCAEIINKFGKYRENLIVIVAAFTFSLYLEIEGSPNQVSLAWKAIFFVVGLFIYCALEWKIDKNKIKIIEEIAQSSGIVHPEDREKIEIAQRTIKAISPFNKKGVIQLILLIFAFCCLFSLTKP